MKKIVTIFFITICLFFAAKAQEQTKPTPQLLKEPANWEFERFPLPPSFATSIPFKGVEELRFAPGMFKKDSADYFSYAFVAQLDSTTNISRREINNYLLSYFKGLCSSVAAEKKLTIDTSKITVWEERRKGTDNERIYDAELNIFGVFTDAAPVTLHAEVNVLTNIAAKKTYLIFIASPQPKSNSIWKELYKIQKGFVMP